MIDKAPLTLEELTDAADEFFPKFDFIIGRLPEGTPVKDVLHVMDVVGEIGYKHREGREKIVGFIGPADTKE